MTDKTKLDALADRLEKLAATKAALIGSVKAFDAVKLDELMAAMTALSRCLNDNLPTRRAALRARSETNG